MSENNKTALAIVAHPDDVEFLCAGTLALLKERGWNIQMATMTAGDLGSLEYSREEISKIRKEEAANSAKLLSAEYHCLECEDLFVSYDRPTILKVVKLIRQVKPKIVFTMSPDCYMIDHEITSRLVQSGCFAAGMTNLKSGDVPPYFFIPYLYYLDAMEGKDKFGKGINPSMVVDISSVIDIKKNMLSCHKSQGDWLKAHHGMDVYTQSMLEFSHKRGKSIGEEYGEGFRQHLGHAFPQDNILKEELKGLVR